MHRHGALFCSLKLRAIDGGHIPGSLTMTQAIELGKELLLPHRKRKVCGRQSDSIGQLQRPKWTSIASANESERKSPKLHLKSELLK
jgi:hypothetical protein